MDSDCASKSAEVWLLALLKPNGFARAKTNLQRQGISTFMPMISRSSRSGKAPVTQPLFPGYLFVRFNPLKTPITTINSTFGVSYIVTSGCDVRRGLPLKLVQGLRARCDEHGNLLPINGLKVNESVRIIAGPFSQFVAVVDKLKGAERVQVLFEIMGQTVRSEIATNDLERLNKKGLTQIT